MTQQKSKNRLLAEQISALTGASLIKINKDAYEFLAMGMFVDLRGALEYMLLLAEEGSL